MNYFSSRFEFQGAFSGFFRDVHGKRRMVLSVDGEDVFLRIPKMLRRALDGQIRRGGEVVVIGREVAHPREGKYERVVFGVREAGDSACMTCPILVCARKSCWRNGGKELWRALERRIEKLGLEDVVRLKAVDCLDRCDDGPCAEWAGEEFDRCRADHADRIVETAAGCFT